MASVSTTTNVTTKFVEEVYLQTNYEPDLRQEADAMYNHFKTLLPDVIESSDGKKLVKQYTTLASTVSTEGTFNDLIKIIWRMVKEMGGTAQYKLCLFFLGVGTVYSVIEKKASGRPVEVWLKKVEKWLGNQLTIGGKGVAGEGEGSVNDRIQRFFSTPYLHDFD